MSSAADRRERNATSRFPKTLPLLIGSHALENRGQRIQHEKSDEVNRLLLDFLAKVRPILRGTGSAIG